MRLSLTNSARSNFLPTAGPVFRGWVKPQERQFSSLDYLAGGFALADEARFNLSYQVQDEGEEIIRKSDPATESRERTKVSTAGATAQLSKLLNSTQWLTYGFEYYRDAYDTCKQSANLVSGAQTEQTPGSPDSAYYQSLGLYLQDELRLHPSAELIAGLRYSRFDTRGAAPGQSIAQSIALSTDAFTGSLYGLLRLSDALNLVGGVAQGFRAPNIEDFFGRVNFVAEIPNAKLRPESALDYELGLKYFGTAATGEVFVYQADYEDLIDRVDVAPGVKQRQNLGQARVRGVETLWRQSFSERWSGSMTATYTRGDNLTRKEPLRRIPPLNGALSLRYAHDARLWGEVWAQLAERQDRLAAADISDPRIGPQGTPGYGVFGLRGGWRLLPATHWLLTLENVTDRQYKTHGSGLFAPRLSARLGWQQGFGGP